MIRPVRLWPSDSGHERRVTWLELFFDLIFVAAIAQIGAALAADYSVHGLVRFAFMFLLIWWAWLGHTNYATRFDADDGLHRLLTFVQIFAAAAMAANSKASFESRDSAGFGAAYAALRLVLVIQYLRARRIPETRRMASLYSVGFGVAALLWCLAALLPAPERFWVWGAAMVVDLGTPWIGVKYIRQCPADPVHLPERFGLFTIILLGESVAAVMHGMENQETWPPSAAISAIMGLALAFAYWWWYFDGARGAGDRHVKSKEDAFRFQLWSYVHLPLYLAIAVVGVGVEHVISLTPGEQLHREGTWILVGAGCATMVALTVIGLTSKRRQPKSSILRLVLSLLILLPAVIVDDVPPFIFVMALTLMAAVQATVSLRDSASPERQVLERKKLHCF